MILHHQPTITTSVRYYDNNYWYYYRHWQHYTIIVPTHGFCSRGGSCLMPLQSETVLDRCSEGALSKKLLDRVWPNATRAAQIFKNSKRVSSCPLLCSCCFILRVRQQGSEKKGERRSRRSRTEEGQQGSVAATRLYQIAMCMKICRSFIVLHRAAVCIHTYSSFWSCVCARADYWFFLWLFSSPLSISWLLFPLCLLCVCLCVPAPLRLPSRVHLVSHQNLTTVKQQGLETRTLQQTKGVITHCSRGARLTRAQNPFLPSLWHPPPPKECPA